MAEEVRLEIYTRKETVKTIVTGLMEAAHTGLPGDGIVAAVPVETLFLNRTRGEATPDQFWSATRA